MNKLLDIFIEWAKTRERWPLLLLFAIPVAFSATQQYFDLTFRDTVHHWSFLIFSGSFIIISGFIHFAVSPNRLRLRYSWIASGFVLLGISTTIVGILQLKSPSLSKDRLVVAIALFTPINDAAKNEAKTLPHRIAKKLREKPQDAIPLEIKILDLEIIASSESKRHEVALNLGRSRQGAAHLILWGDVRKEDGELYIELQITVVQPLGKVIIDEQHRGEFVSTEPNFLQFKRMVSAKTADLVTFIYGLAFFKTSQWDKAVEVLTHVQSTEGRLYKALSLKGKYIDHFRLKGPSDLSENILEDSKHELAVSFESFMNRDNFDLAALTSIGLGDVLRMLRNQNLIKPKVFESAGIAV